MEYLVARFRSNCRTTLVEHREMDIQPACTYRMPGGQRWHLFLFPGWGCWTGGGRSTPTIFIAFLIGACKVGVSALRLMCGMTSWFASSERNRRLLHLPSEIFHWGKFPIQIINAATAPTSTTFPKSATGQRLTFLLHVYIVARWSRLSTPLFVEL